MKKLKLFFALCCGMLCASQAEAGLDPLAKTSWTVSACTECTASQNEDGLAANIIDGNSATIWHSNYDNNDKAVPHYFIIDCQTSVTFNAFGYTPRQSATNGRVSAYSLYVSDTAFSITNGDTSVQSDLAGMEAVSTGTFTWGTDDVAQKVVQLDRECSGRYILFLITAAENGHGSCAEFDLGTYTYVDPEIAHSNAVSLLDGLSSLMPDATWNSLNNWTKDTTLSDDDNATAVQTLINACYNALNNQIVTLKSAYWHSTSGSSGTNNYYIGINGTAVKAQTYVNEQAKWQLKQVSTGSTYYYLYNPESKRYMSTTASGLATATSSAIQVTPVINTTTNPNGFGLQVSGEIKGLHLGGTASNLTTWNATESAGSSWILTPTSTPATELSTDKWYRIRNNRALDTYTAQGSLVAAYGVTGSGGVDGDLVHMSTDCAGAIWQLKAVDGGGYQIRSLIGDYAEGEYAMSMSTSTNAQITLSNSPTTYYIIPATNYGVSEQMLNGVALSVTNATCTTTQKKCVDVSTATTTFNSTTVRCPLGNAWAPDGASNQGSVFYFEEVDDADLAKIKTDYIASLTWTDDVSTNSRTNFTLAETLNTEESTLFPEALDFTMPAESTAGLTSIKEAVALYRNHSIDNDEYLAALNKFYAQPTKQEIQFHQGDYWLGSDGDVITSVTDGAGDRTTIWLLEANPAAAIDADNGYLPYIVKNVLTEKYLGYQTYAESDTTYPMAEESSAKPFGFLYEASYGGLKLTNGVAEAVNSVRNCIYLNENSAAIWGPYVMQTALTPSFVTYKELTYPATETSQVVFSGMKPCNNSNLQILLHYIRSLTGTASAPAMRRTTAQTADGDYILEATEDGIITIPNDIPTGIYQLTVPTGYFYNEATGTFNKEFSEPFSVGDGGVVTEINEISVDSAEADPVCYDLQGRRIYTPGRGLYILNGKVTLMR